MHYLALYINDMIISGNDIIGITELKGHLMCYFKMKDPRHLIYFLGLEISRTSAAFGFISRNMQKNYM